MTDQDHMEKSVIGPVIESLLENFDCQPVLFVGSGLARRYTDSPDWEGLLRFALTMFPGTAPNYDYLAQKHNNNLVLIGSEIASHIFEWAWGNGKNSFPPELFTHKDKSIFLKYLVSKMLKDLKPGEAIASSVTFFDEFDALRSIRPHAIITTNYDTMLEDIYLGYEPIVGKQVLRYNLNAYGEVYHIHGSVNDPSTLVITEDDYQKWEDESKYFAAKLLTYFAEHPVIIFGYSITDKNVRTLLQDIGAIVADDTGLIANVLQVIWNDKIEGDAVQTEIAIPIDGSQFRIRAIETNSLLGVFQALAARHELKDVNVALVRALAARAMKLTRSDIPNGDIEVNYKTLEGIANSEKGLATLLGITQADDLNKSHPYTLTLIGEKLGYQDWNGANKLLEKIKKTTGINIKSCDNKYHCAIKVGKAKNSISRKYSDALLLLLEQVRDGKDYSVIL